MNKKRKNQASPVKFSAWLVLVLTLVCFFCAPLTAFAKEDGSERVMVGGELFGTKIRTDGLLVVGTASVMSDKKERFPARDAGICSKDIICALDGKKVFTSEEFVTLIEKSEGKELEISLLRGGENINVKLKPVKSDADGFFRAGLWIRDSLAGIGTVTFTLPDTLEFVGLGHGICDPDTGVLMPVREGSVFEVALGDVKKGSVGAPGELRGKLSEKRVGKLLVNSICGVYGVFAEKTGGGDILPVADKDEISVGKAEIVCSVKDGQKAKYSAEIEKICDADGKTKNFVIRITDKTLLSLTGGIVQGMSGSPVIQNGKLVGAVTHVLVDDPTRGYGIFIENMLANE